MTPPFRPAPHRSFPCTYKVALYQAIVHTFTLDEFRTLCFYLDVAYDHLQGEALLGKARELILLYERIGQLEELVATIQQIHPTLCLPLPPTTSPQQESCPPSQ